MLLLFSGGFESLNPEQQMEFPACVSQQRRISRITSSHMLSRYLLAAGGGRSQPNDSVAFILTTHNDIRACFMYLVNTFELHMPAFDTDLSVAYLKGNRRGHVSEVAHS